MDLPVADETLQPGPAVVARAARGAVVPDRAAGGTDAELAEGYPHEVVDGATSGSRVVDDHQSPGQ